MDLVAATLPLARDPGEELLAAAAISLLAQPRLWAGLKLPPALPALAAQRPWSTYWSARLALRWTRPLPEPPMPPCWPASTACMSTMAHCWRWPR